MNSPDTIVGVGPRTPHDDNPASLEAGGDVEAMNPALRLMSAWCPPAATLSGPAWKLAAKTELLTGRWDGEDITLDDLRKGNLPDDLVGLLPAAGMTGWHKDHFKPTRLIIGDCDALFFAELAEQAKQAGDFAPAYIRASSRHGGHPFWILNRPVNTPEEATQARKALHRLSGIPGDKGSYANTLRFSRFGAEGADVAPGNIISKDRLAIKTSTMTSTMTSTNSTGIQLDKAAKVRRAVVERTFSEYHSTGLAQKWAGLVNLCPCRKGLPEHHIETHLEINSKGSYRIGWRGRVRKFGSDSKEYLSNSRHGDKIPEGFIQDILPLMYRCRAKTNALIEQVARIPQYPGGLVPGYKILEVCGAKPSILASIGWRQRRIRIKGKRTRVIEDSLGSIYKSIKEVKETHVPLLKAGLLPGVLVSPQGVLGTLVTRFRRFRKETREMVHRLLRLSPKAQGKKQGFKRIPHPPHMAWNRDSTPNSSPSPPRNPNYSPWCPGITRFQFPNGLPF